MEKRRFLYLSTLSLIALSAIVITTSRGLSKSNIEASGTNSYLMTFNSSSRLTEQDNRMYTGSHYPISFSYTGSLTTYSEGWQTLNGSVYNQDSIKGITSLNAVFSGSLKISYGYKTNSQIYYIVTESLSEILKQAMMYM